MVTFVFFEHEAQDLLDTVRDNMRKHDLAPSKDEEERMYHAQQSRRAKHLLEVMNPKHTTR